MVFWESNLHHRPGMSGPRDWNHDMPVFCKASKQSGIRASSTNWIWPRCATTANSSLPSRHPMPNYNLHRNLHEQSWMQYCTGGFSGLGESVLTKIFLNYSGTLQLLRSLWHFLVCHLFCPSQRDNYVHSGFLDIGKYNCCVSKRACVIIINNVGSIPSQEFKD